ncbi:hypothetical protein VOLCADRAFT_92566 [Volvox carteri f. nagariensis]|uniref:Uncharacterized protein n=1 Tax=Volvox carteri f. nagariensis TaxID=3068 RepID=D8U001_VOLCA|nr:uncharacterized protein VOLCADRAFT_92566 [Volvox carteri f. nagariensis]EFJ47095.1 hypothetical protein VOLCADRAFT_92566 [Volvox carteri f. nagariensis]|eukprot:XP_002951990.1 hypothetical protein VOLCADRAFT_92566 [Volvox carteri f. nagariensis]
MGGLCSREDREPFDDVKSGNHTGSKPNTNNHVASVGQPTHAEATVPASELIALKAQLQQLQERNSALLSAAKDSESRYAELQSKLQELQKEHDGLQREFEATRQLAGSGLQAQLEARAEAERKLAEVQRQYTELKNMNNQLRRRVSDLATGHAEPPVAAPSVEQPTNAFEERNRDVLAKIRDSNPGSKISIAFWRSSDFKRWQGVRTLNGEVTGLALNSMQLTVLPSEVGQLTSLTALLLSNNGLTQLPSTLGQLTCLTSLLLDGNNLKQLPAELCDLCQLQTLWLDNNKITELPETFSQLSELKRLRVDSALANVPEQFRGNGAMTPVSPRTAPSTFTEPDGASGRAVNERVPLESVTLLQQQHSQQDTVQLSSSAAESPRRESDGDEGHGRAEALSRSPDSASLAASDRVVREGSGPALCVKGRKEQLALGSLSGTGTSAGIIGVEQERSEPADGEVIAQHTPVS